MTDLLATVRFLHVASCSLFVGSGAFDLLIATPALRPYAPSGAEARLGWERTRRRLTGWSLALASLSAVAWLLLEAALMSGRPLGQAVALPLLGTVLARTVFGRVWTVRLTLFLLAGVVLLLARSGRANTGRPVERWAGALLGSLALALIAWVGHAGGGEGASRAMTLFADTIHLLATGVWLGGLLPFALFLLEMERPATAAGGLIAHRAVHRFSALAFGCVAGLVLTGLGNTWVLVGSVPALIGTPYGRLLLLKGALVGFVLAVAALNRYRLVPSLDRAEDGQGPRLGHLARNVLIEAGIGGAILLVVGFLGITPPAHHEAPVWPFAFRLTWTAPAEVPGDGVALLVGGLGVLLGLLVLACGVRHRCLRCGGVVLMGAALLVGYGVEARRFVAVVDATPTTYRQSPVAYEVRAIAHGLQLYQAQCALCHGAGGHGDGLAGQALWPRPADLTGAHLGHHTPGDLFWWLTHGIPGSAMPAFAEHLSETDRWDVITFLRALVDGSRTAMLTSAVTAPAWCEAPDFAFTNPDGTQVTLRETRGKTATLLVLAPWPASRERLSQWTAAQPALAAAGARVVIVPLGQAAPSDQAALRRAAPDAVALEEAAAIADTYALFLGPGTAPPLGPDRSPGEFLIDRHGYLRARWRQGAPDGWEDLTRIRAAVTRLAQEPRRAAPPEAHAH